MRSIAFGMCAALLWAAPALAQDAGGAGANAETAPAEAPAGVDPARLAAARRVIDRAMPPEEARAMITSLVGTAFDQQIALMGDDPALKAVMRSNPTMRRTFDTFLRDVRGITEQVMGDATPALLTAMTEIYADRFSVAELVEIEAFLATPTGSRYARESFDMMGDERLVRWQAEIGERMETRMAPLLERFVADSIRLGVKEGS